MKLLAFLGGCIALAVAGWFISSALSSDAVGMIVGLLFGILASVPPALLVLVAARRNQAQRDPYYPPPRYEPPPPQPPAQLPGPTIIVVQLPDGRMARALLMEGKADHIAGE